MDPWLQKNLVCPRDLSPLHLKVDSLTCSSDHTYPCIDGIPIMLLKEAKPTQKEFLETLERAASGLTPSQAEDEMPPEGSVDPFVQEVLGATCGLLYSSLASRLTTYPIPDLRLPRASGEHFLDVGCNWGRWCIAATRKGYVPVGIDHNWDAIRAARRVSKQLGANAIHLVADARHLPFSTGCFDVIFSYSVLQHFSKPDAKQAIAEAGRVLKRSGKVCIQMPNAFGMRNLYLQLRRGFKDPGGFGVRYWSPKELEETFEQFVGPTSFQTDGYFSLNAQVSDLPLLPPKHRFVILISEWLKRVSTILAPVKYMADSLYVEAVRHFDSDSTP